MSSRPRREDPGRERPGRRPRAKRGRSGRKPGEIPRKELVCAVCGFFCQGYTVKDIVKAVAEQHSVHMNREQPYALVRYAARMGWLRFQPPQHLALAEELRRRYPWLRDIHIEVVPATDVRDIANYAALALRGLLQAIRRRGDRDAIHIGFAGGHSMRALARAFADLLCQPAADLPEAVVYHAIAAGFEPTDPTTEPNAFFTYFLNEPLMQVRALFMGLCALAMVKPADLQRLRDLADIRDAFEAVGDLDIIVTSGTEWLDDHSSLRRRLEGSRASIEMLEREGCVGDIFWRPIADHGPIEAETEIRALTLIELSDLPGFIRAGKRVLLMLAPCGGCHRPKGRLLKCVLEQRKRLITDLVVDSRSVEQMLRLAPAAQGGP